MKQNITSKQLEELSKRGKKKLQDWNDPEDVGFGLPLLSIGQMIEFLHWEECPLELQYFVSLFVSKRKMGNQDGLCVVKEKLEK